MLLDSGLRVSEGLHRYLWLVKLAGGLVALGFATSAGLSYWGLGAVEAGEGPGSAVPESFHDEGDASDGSRGAAAGPSLPNLFCPTCAPVAPEEASRGPEEGEEGDEATPLASASDRPAVLSTLPLTLVATMESDDPSTSLATVLDRDRGAVGSFGVGDLLRAGVRVTAIGRGRLELLNGGRREYIVMGSAPPPTAEPADDEEARPKVRASVRASGGGELEFEGAREAISCKGDSCSIDRAFLERALADTELLEKQARLVPSISGGETEGVKVYGVRPGSLPNLLGIHNGDMIRSVGGKASTAPEDAAGLYATLRDTGSASVVIDRRGKTITKDITVK